MSEGMAYWEIHILDNVSVNHLIHEIDKNSEN